MKVEVQIYKTNPDKIEKIVSNTKSGGFIYSKFTLLLTRVAKNYLQL